MLNNFRKKWSVCAGIFILIGCFLLLKSDATGWQLPLGYSVFAFSGISLLVDVRKSDVSHKIIDQLCYLFFVPKIFAGPIIRSKDFISQLDKLFNASRNDLYLACKLLIYSGFCKFIVADNLVQEIMLNSLQGIELFIASLIYGIRFFIDFYAYSIMAVAISLFVGIKLPYNFCNPYHSTSFREFWKHWNITLSEWLRDYIYIPLGGSRNGKSIAFLNITIAFTVSSLWHGVSIPFLIWGGMHALFLIVEKSLELNTSRCYGYLVVIVCCLMWQLFRLETISDINQYCIALISSTEITSATMFIKFAFSVMFVLVIGLPSFEKKIFQNINSVKDVYVEVAICASMLTTLILFPGQASFNFFYMQY